MKNSCSQGLNERIPVDVQIIRNISTPTLEWIAVRSCHEHELCACISSYTARVTVDRLRSDRITISLSASIAKHLSISMPTLFTKMSGDSNAVVIEEAPAAAVAVAAADIKVDDDFAIWLRLDSKPGKEEYVSHVFAV